ncbi:putative Ig domain-containing protein [Streptomyces sp. FH025]|uniref:DUF7507 domain-containing protein n=1 Tax=Streptomyces sp. FH025 TaxID=2815937 RepID=UPI001A9EC663|nr:putative Ig domain-containing protein [Streptomyces sp. FH025]MBO1413032.1 hypothetical protein [Streptomyces sp. FH025]
MKAASVLLAAAMLSGQLALGTPASSAAGKDPDITTACAGTVSGSIFTLSADCDTTVTLTVPNGFTLDGAGHTITAHDANSGASDFFHGPVLTNAGATMNLNDLTVRGTGFAFHCDNANPTVGVQFTDASGSMSDVRVLDITQHSDCLTVHGILIRSAAVQQTVTMADVTVSDYQRTGLLVMGKATVDVGGSTFGPPDLTVPNPGRLAQNSVQYGSPSLPGPSSGTFADNTVYGTAFGTATNVSTALLVADADPLTITRNTFTGAGTDVGIAIVSSQNVTVSYNAIGRGAPDRPGFQDPFGIGVSVDDASAPTTKLICNTFAGWNENLENITQPPCITTTTIPCAPVDQPYSATLHATTENPSPQLTWSLVTGPMPPGLTLNADGTITGTPTVAGTYTITVQVSDPVDGTSTGQVTLCITPVAVTGIEVDKSVVTPAPYSVGQTVTYSYTVRNTGTVELTGVAVADDHVTGISCQSTTLAPSGSPGSTTTCTGTYVITAADGAAGSVTNTATASGVANGVTITSPTTRLTLPVGAPHLTLKKRVLSSGPFTIGSKIEYTYTVTNTGSTPLTGITVTDDRVADVTCDATTLAPGASTVCHGTYTITYTDAIACRTGKDNRGGGDHDRHCTVTNVATATGTDPQGKQVTSEPAKAIVPVDIRHHCHGKPDGKEGCDTWAALDVR